MAVLLTNAAATLFMTGVIWIVQVVHYPLFAGVGAEGFGRYSTDHARLITYVVLPAMLVELATAALLALRPGALGASAYIGLALVGLIWASTFFVQVPLHERLSTGFDGQAHRLLVSTNWLRTGLWTARAGLTLWWLNTALAK